jgi:hypothetical protein
VHQSDVVVEDEMQIEIDGRSPDNAAQPTPLVVTARLAGSEGNVDLIGPIVDARPPISQSG